ncbi:hypothetical protein LOTGIDRAFT_109332, partial [Lottia gigantea]
IPDYNDFTCAWCHFYLFQRKSFAPSLKVPFLMATMNGSTWTRGRLVKPDPTNRTSVNMICESLNSDECDRWKMCCQSARECCRDQIAHPPVTNSTCIGTWDGYGCWRDANPDTENYLSCPNFLQYSIPTRNALKYCHSNGTWMKINGSQWTDYTPCLDKESLIESIYLSLGCNIASILLLLPAIAIFLVYRPLRKQHRIRLHISFFLSFILSDVTAILWDVVVTYDRLTNENVSQSVLYQNGAGCKALSFFRIYCKSTNYVWMFCEGFYLHRLISNAFKPPKSLYPLYLTGWGLPMIYSVIYAALRASLANESCWAKSFGQYEWIIYAPNLLCLVVNLFFLCNILRVLVTQLQTHPNEPSHFRRALKATFVLIPLFGIQLFVTLYRVPAGSEAAGAYEKFTTFVINSQGFFVALIFCFCNGEVRIKEAFLFRCRFLSFYFCCNKPIQISLFLTCFTLAGKSRIRDHDK